MTSKTKPNVRGKEAKMHPKIKKGAVFQAGLNFEHYVRSNQRKQWNSVIPLFKELVDNSRDAEAKNVFFDFHNYKEHTTISSLGGIVSYVDDGRGLPLLGDDLYDWSPVLSFYGNQQTLTNENTKAGLNGIGLKDAVLSMGNQVLFFTKSRETNKIGYIFIDFKGVQNIESIKVVQKQFEEISSDKEVPEHLSKYAKDVLANVKDKLSKEEKSLDSFFGFIVSDTKTDIALGSKEPNNFWKNVVEPKTISKLTSFLLRGSQKDLSWPLCAYYPPLEGIEQPLIWINGEKSPEIKNLESAYWNNEGEIENLDKEGFFDESYSSTVTEKNLVMTSSYRISRQNEIKNENFLLSKGGFTVIRGGTIAAVCFQPNRQWGLDNQRSRRFNVKLHFKNVKEFDEHFSLSKNKVVQMNSKIISEGKYLNAILEFIRPFIDKVNESYKNQEQEVEKTESSFLDSIRERLENFHKENYVDYGDKKQTIKKEQSPQTESEKPKDSKRNYVRGIFIKESDELNPSSDYEFEKSENGNSFAITIFMRHPKIRKVYTECKQQLLYIVDIYATEMADGDLAKSREIRDSLLSQWINDDTI